VIGTRLEPRAATAAGTAKERRSVETPSGKWRQNENFPVGSWMIRRDLRAHVHAFYRFARTADDIADNPELTPEDKLRRLDRMAAILDGTSGQDSPAAAAMRDSLVTSGMTAEHCRDVLRAFRLDATKKRYENWDVLMEYCRYSAAPVGRQLLDLHREKRDTWPASDALCTALQVINHLQDCVDDYHRLDRVYIPLADLAEAGIGVEALAAPAAGRELRRVFDVMLDRTAGLVATARSLPRNIRSRRLRRESAVIVALAGRLVGLLRQGDPLARPVVLRKRDYLVAFLAGAMWG